MRRLQELTGRGEAEAIRAQFGAGHVIDRPAVWRAPVVFASPHSGAVYPDALQRASIQTLATLRRNEDAYVDHLFACASGLGAPLIKARFPRCYVDVNRPPDDLPPDWAPMGARIGPEGSYRARMGLGVVPLVISERQAIYRHPPSRREARARLDALYHPYHRALGGLLRRARESFGRAVLIDCHSMPGQAVERGRSRRADVVLGDAHGRAASAATTDLLHAAFERRGYRVARNHPYAGGYATLHYGRPEAGVEAVQIELNRDLYLDRDTLEASAGYGELAGEIAAICGELLDALAPEADCREAAE